MYSTLLQLVPMNIAANTLTFVGFMLLPLSFVILAYYDYDFTRNHSIPQWVWLMCAFNNFMSHTLGKFCVSPVSMVLCITTFP